MYSAFLLAQKGYLKKRFVFSEKLNIKFVSAEARAGILTSEEKERLKILHEEKKHFLRIPRR